MIYITHIRLGTAGSGHEHITHVRWNQPSEGKGGDCSTATMVDWLDNKSIQAYVQGPPDVRVGTVDASPKYLRTYADKVWTNNLLDLPTF